MNQLYGTIGISKQAVAQYEKRENRFNLQLERLIDEAEMLRREHPGCGVEKMYYVLNPGFLGRDRFTEIMMDAGFRLTKRRNFKRTTYSSRVHYPNLIKGMSISAPCKIWQSDITFIEVGNQFYYAVFIIDVYSKKIVGYNVASHMRTTANLQALSMALKTNKAPAIHHSDRGSQYTCLKYINLLRQHQTRISMAIKPQDNAYAERINRTIKSEYLDYWKPKTFDQLRRQLTKAVDQYNHKRPHDHLNKLTPVLFEKRWRYDPSFEKPIITIFDDTII